jgi:flagellar hook-length control protein FliK
MNNGMNISNLHGFTGGKKNSAAAGAAGTTRMTGSTGADAVPKALSGEMEQAGNSGGSESGVFSFRRVYDEIATCNKIAQSNNGAKNGTDFSTTDQDAALQALLGSGLFSQISGPDGVQIPDIQQLLGGSGVSNSPGTMSADAAALIREAIATITKTLHLKIQDGLENLASITPSQAIVGQFAEMLSTLKGIAGILDESVKQNQPLEYKTLAFDVQSAATSQQVIHEQMFKIELALKMMGISGDVAAAMAQKDGAAQAAVATISGIPQATDPSKLAMPAIHVKQVLGEVFISKEQKVETLLSKLAETLKKNGAADGTALLTKIARTAAGAHGDANKTAMSDIKEIGPLDSQVMRKLLKVDPAQTTESENKNAAQQNVTLGLPKAGKMLTSASFADLAQQGKNGEGATAFLNQNAVGVSQASDKIFSALRTSDTGTMRQFEESVVRQVSDNLTAAAKNGITELRVMLRPESLGEVQLRIKVDGDVVMGKMYVENQQVKHIVEANLQTLKDSLSQHNLTVGSFSVDVNHGNNAHDHMRDMADMGTKDGNGNANNSKEGRDETDTFDPTKTIVSGMETGRKFGTNTIEFFA